MRVTESVAMEKDRKFRRKSVDRVQTGVRVEKRILKVLKAVAAEKEMSLGDLLEGVCLHVFEGKQPFGPDTRRKIAELKELYELDLTAADSHRLKETGQ
jgi:hypothetical protein